VRPFSWTSPTLARNLEPRRVTHPRENAVPSELDSFLAFLGEQKVRQSAFFPTVKHDKVLSFMATTGATGSASAVSIHRVDGLEVGPNSHELFIRLAGPLAHPPADGECVTVHLTRPEHYQGFQVKTRPLGGKAALADLVDASEDRLLVKGANVYTVHHSPYTLKFFETVPLEEVVETVGPVRYAMVNVGPAANLSPRFVFHHEVQDGRLVLFHGDGLALKTYMNLRSNPRETRLVVDLETYRGYAARGVVEEFAPHQHPEAYDRICRGFTAGGWGKPSRVFRLSVEELVPIAPVG
jgi:hypothetical protein